MEIRAQVRNRYGEHEAILTTNGESRPIAIAPRTSGCASNANGGELLFLALATCYCNDICREAAKRGIAVEQGACVSIVNRGGTAG
jgi:organic hydroperoxide reductase OsmC/OhrA